MITLLIVAGAFCFWGFKSGDSRSFQIAKNLDIFNSIVKELDMFYVDTIDPNKTIREGIDAMLYSLDPYTEYYPEDDQSELEQMLKNSYGGIGSVITWNPKLKRSMISEPYENMPAADVGLKAGDILMEIDGKDLAGKNNQEVSEMPVSYTHLDVYKRQWLNISPVSKSHTSNSPHTKEIYISCTSLP